MPERTLSRVILDHPNNPKRRDIERAIFSSSRAPHRLILPAVGINRKDSTPTSHAFRIRAVRNLGWVQGPRHNDAYVMYATLVEKYGRFKTATISFTRDTRTGEITLTHVLFDERGERDP